MSGTVYILLALAIATEVAREICFKLSADKVAAGEGYFRGLLARPLLWLGFILWGVQIIVWIMTLARVPLNIAFPVMSLCYAGTLIASKLFLGEEISRRKWAGVGLITIGVAIVGSMGI